ncbi:MAG: hypothetical protein ACW99F_00830 [Candidatus Hodarchaeales archaeon]|jgi:hypothetical protein
MSIETMITEPSKGPNPQKVRWTNVAYYDNFNDANDHRNNLNGLTKVRRCGPDKTKFVVKSGTPIGDINE